MHAALDNSVTYCFGIGAQKAGTTWLASYLRKHPDVHVPDVKEMHYFDALSDPTARRAYGKIADKIATLKAEGREDETSFLKGLIEMIDAPGEDHAVYRRLMTEGRGTAAIVADITPSYALLSKDDLARMASEFPGSKFIYILRDPIDRTRSQLKMLYKNRPETRADQSYEAFVDGFVSGKAHQGILARTRYDEALDKIEAVLPDDRRLVLFYEELFSDAGVGKVCTFLGIPFKAGAYGKMVHAATAPKNTEADARLTDALVTRLAPIYEQMDKRYGEALPETWKAALATVRHSKRQGTDGLAQQER